MNHSSHLPPQHHPLQHLDLERAHTLEMQAHARRRGNHGRTVVRPAARLAQPYELLNLYFNYETLTRAVGSGTQYASSASLVFPTMLPLGGYSMLLPDTLGYTVNNAALGGAFVSFLALTLDDNTEFGLNGLQMICTSGSGRVSVNGPTFNDVGSIGPARKVVSARIRLQADGPGTATATLVVGAIQVYLFRSHLGRTLSVEV